MSVPPDAPTDVRISFPTPETMTEAQRAVFDDIVSGPRGTLVGPLRAAMHNPALADRWQRLGRVLRFETSLPARLSELAILVTARRWNSPLEWAIHAGDALRAGLDAAVIDAINAGDAPAFGDDAAGREVYEYARQLLQGADVDPPGYAAVTARFGEVGVVELTAVIGYYSMVAMTLNVHRVPLPSGVDDALARRGDGLTALPRAQA